MLLDSLDILGALSQEDRERLSEVNRLRAAGDTTKATALIRARILAKLYIKNPKHLPVVAERLTQGNMRINGLVWSDLQRINFDVKEQLSHGQYPVLILQGEEDILSKSVPRKMHQTFNNSRLVFLPNTVHYGWLDNPELYFSEIEDFLKAAT